MTRPMLVVADSSSDEESMFEDDSSSHELIPQPLPLPRSVTGVTGPAGGRPAADTPLGGSRASVAASGGAQRGRQAGQAIVIYQNVTGPGGTPPMDGGGGEGRGGGGGEEGRRGRSELDVVQHSQQQLPRPQCQSACLIITVPTLSLSQC